MDWIYDVEKVREKLEDAYNEEKPEGFEIKETEMSVHDNLKR